jgi:hypothetical protein
MLQTFIAKKLIDVVLKRVMKAREIKRMRKYVEKDNELDIQMRVHSKALNKYGKVIEDLEKEVAILKKDSHPTIEGLEDRLTKLEKKEK